MNEKKIRQKKKFFLNKSKKEKIENFNPFDRYMDLSNEITHERKRFNFSFLVNMILIFALIYFSLRSDYLPYVIEVDNQTKKLLNSTVLQKNNNELPEETANYFLGRFILDTRSISLDPKLYESNLKEASYFLTPATQQKLKSIIEAENNYLKIQNKTTVNATVKTINKIPNQTNSYQIRWEESQYRNNGELEFTNYYVGIFSIDRVSVKNEEMVKINPFGIIIKDFNISREDAPQEK
mgnify:CR=1 FL=1